MRIALSLIVLSMAAHPIAARAQNDPACAKFQDPLAYNACLASHGPKAKDVAAAPEPDRGATAPDAGRGLEPEPQRGGGRASPAASHSGWPTAARHHGRVHMEFHVR
jgi:hypothetical protein